MGESKWQEVAMAERTDDLELDVQKLENDSSWRHEWKDATWQTTTAWTPLWED